MLSITFSGADRQPKRTKWYQEPQHKKGAKDWLAIQEAERASQSTGMLSSKSASSPQDQPNPTSSNNDEYRRRVQEESKKHEARREGQKLREQQKKEAAALEEKRQKALALERKIIVETCQEVEKETDEAQVYRFPVTTPSLKAIHGDFFEGTMQDYGEEHRKAQGKSPMPQIIHRKKSLVTLQENLSKANPDTGILKTRVIKALARLGSLLSAKNMDGISL
ncbi:MAG: hypothetical protein K0Q50_940 [Vampirovibrio sp.]|jgi:hypothetical protein|nr:hypothetical protein [Vampirovibrio sp.]